MAQTKLIRWISGGVVVLLLILILPGMIPRHDGGTLVTTGGYQVSLTFPESIKVGRNPVSVKILDKIGMPVSDVRVEINSTPVKHNMESNGHMMGGMNHDMSGMPGMNHDMSSMPGMTHDMPGMPGMNHDMPGMNAAPIVAQSHGLHRMPGDYFGVVTFSEPGHWTLNTHLNIDDQTLDANFPIKVVASHLASFAILAGFIILNALIIWTAAVSKRRSLIA